MAIEVKQNDKEFELWYDDLHLGSSKLRCDAELIAKQLRRKVDGMFKMSEDQRLMILKLLNDPEFIKMVNYSSQVNAMEIFSNLAKACRDLQNLKEPWKMF